jgi:hypothetical protein
LPPGGAAKFPKALTLLLSACFRFDVYEFGNMASAEMLFV